MIARHLIMATLLLGGGAVAGTWHEGHLGAGDAGPLPGTAQIPTGTGPLNTIYGRLSSRNGADMYRIRITRPRRFWATAYDRRGDSDVLLMPQLYLFDSIGYPIYGAVPQYGVATLQAGVPFGPQQPGEYLLMINSAGRLPASGGTPLDFKSPAYYPSLLKPVKPLKAIDGYRGVGWSPGPYEIDMFGARFSGIPEPGTLALLGGGLIAIALLRRRKPAR